MIGIYKITNTINGKMYIGQAIDIEKRWKEHEYSSKNGNQIIYRAIRKYGLDRFSFDIVEECAKEDLDRLEILYIKKLNSFFKWDNGGYNMTLGGGGKSGWIVSDETREKISMAHKGKAISEDHKHAISIANSGENNYFYGRYLSGEENGFYGKKHSEDTKLKMKANRGDMSGENHPRYGTHHTEETKRKIGDANRGRVMSEEFKQRCKEANIGGNNHNSKVVACDGMEFSCAREFSEFYNIPYGTVRGWLNGRYPMPQEFIDIDLRYKNDDTVYSPPKRSLKSYVDSIEEVNRKRLGFSIQEL